MQRMLIAGIYSVSPELKQADTQAKAEEIYQFNPRG